MKSPVRYSAVTQLSVVLLITSVLLTEDAVTAYSYCLGALVYVLPNLYFVHYAFRFAGTQNVPLIARSFSWGESGKIALASLGFVLVYRLVEPISHPSLFAGFFSMIIFQWFIAYRIVSARDKSNAD
ncbi:MAG: ATP synthase subunit I [Agarilytica sp.]